MSTLEGYDGEGTPTDEATLEARNEKTGHAELMNRVGFGLDVEAWTETGIGAHLLRRAFEMRDEALEALAVTDPTDAVSITKLQNDARIPALFAQWLKDAIVEGEGAQAQMRENERLR